MLAHSCPSGSWRKRAPLLLVRPVCQRPSPLLLPPLPTMASRFSGSRRRFSILSRKKNKSGEKVLFSSTFLISPFCRKLLFGPGGNYTSLQIQRACNLPLLGRYSTTLQKHNNGGETVLICLFAPSSLRERKRLTCSSQFPKVPRAERKEDD